MSHWAFGLGFPAPQSQVGVRSAFFATSYINEIAYRSLGELDHRSPNFNAESTRSSHQNDNVSLMELSKAQEEHAESAPSRDPNENVELMELSKQQEDQIQQLNAKVESLKTLKEGQDFLLEKMREQVDQLEDQVKVAQDEALALRIQMNDIMRQAQEESSFQSSPPSMSTTMSGTIPGEMPRPVYQPRPSCSTSSQVDEHDLINVDESPEKPRRKKQKTLRSRDYPDVQKRVASQGEGCAKVNYYLCDIPYYSRSNHNKDHLVGKVRCTGCGEFFTGKSYSDHKEVCSNLLTILQPEVTIMQENGEVFLGDPNLPDGEVSE